jgi:hypothetical protein
LPSKKLKKQVYKLCPILRIMGKKENKSKIREEIIEKYRKITEKALGIAKKSISKGKEKQAKEIIKMVECYLSDSRHFQSKDDLINSFGAIYYSHGWLDAGARLKIFDVSDSDLFTI